MAFYFKDKQISHVSMSTPLRVFYILWYNNLTMLSESANFQFEISAVSGIHDVFKGTFIIFKRKMLCFGFKKENQSINKHLKVQ